MERARNILKQFLEEKNLLKNDANNNLFKSWEDIIGNKIYKHSKIIDILNKVLIIEIDHPGWLQIIKMKEEEILKKIRQKYPDLDIKYLKYKVNLK